MGLNAIDVDENRVWGTKIMHEVGKKLWFSRNVFETVHDGSIVMLEGK